MNRRFHTWLQSLHHAKDLIVKAIHIMNPRQKRTYAASLLFMVFNSLLELLTLGLLVPFISAVAAPGAFPGTARILSSLALVFRSVQDYPAAVLGISVLALFLIKNIAS